MLQVTMCRLRFPKTPNNFEPLIRQMSKSCLIAENLLYVQIERRTLLSIPLRQLGIVGPRRHAVRIKLEAGQMCVWMRIQMGVNKGISFITIRYVASETSNARGFLIRRVSQFECVSEIPSRNKRHPESVDCRIAVTEFCVTEDKTGVLDCLDEIV